MVNEMGRIFIGITFIIFIITGCQPDEIGEVLLIEHNDIKDNNIEEVLNDHNNIKNLHGLNTFVENVNNQKEAVINYVQYGTEGQRGIRTLTSENEYVNVFHSVDGEFIEEYTCTKLIIEKEEKVDKYILKQCTGDFEGNFEFLTLSNEDK
jgi:hypothetical protein